MYASIAVPAGTSRKSFSGEPVTVMGMRATAAPTLMIPEPAQFCPCGAAGAAEAVSRAIWM